MAMNEVLAPEFVGVGGSEPRPHQIVGCLILQMDAVFNPGMYEHAVLIRVDERQGIRPV